MAAVSFLVGAALILLASALSVLAAAIWKDFRRKAAAASASPKGEAKEAPGPRPWPLLGSLHLLGKHETPFEAFTALSKTYGEVYSIRLGTVPCLVVNSFRLIKEVLITKGAHFGGRPDFIRFHKLFGGDRDNSLALCDWSDLQRTRRRIARVYCSPRLASAHYDRLDAAGASETALLLDEVQRRAGPNGSAIHIKPLLLAACSNMFTRYMCSRRFEYNDTVFVHMVRRFDDIFWDINQGYAVDFLPWLLPLYRTHMTRLSLWAHEIRQFILSSIIEPHRRAIEEKRRKAEEAKSSPSSKFDSDIDDGPSDFTEALLLHLENDPDLTWQHVLFELEDFLGGHSAIGNLLMLSLAAAAKETKVAERIREEADLATGGGARPLSLSDRASMPYTEATVLETLRRASSPIVPHVATQDTSVDGYAVSKGTVVFLNNYELNTSEEHWEAPTEFRPERFLCPTTGRIVKPEFFIPFGTGKRTCIGSRLVHAFGFLLLGSLVQRFDISPAAVEGDSGLPEDRIHTIPACVALPPDTFPLLFTPRSA